MRILKRAWLLIALIGLLLPACTSGTTLLSSWRDPSYRSGTFAKPIVLAIASRPIVRAKLEDAFVQQLRAHGVDAVQSYQTWPNEEGLTAATIKAKLPETDRDSIIVTHLVDVKHETVVVPAQTETWYGGYPGYYERFGPYYGQSYSTVYSPGYTYELEKYVLETNLYDAKSEKRVWTVATESVNASSLDSSVKDFVGIVMNEVEKNKLFRQ